MVGNSRWEGFSGGKEFPEGKISWWEGVPSRKGEKRFPGGKDFLVVGNSRWEGFSGGKEFPAGKISWWPVGRISWW